MEVLRYAAFTREPSGGNPAGVVLDARGLDSVDMLSIAQEVGYSETAFLKARQGVVDQYDVRYFSPLAEVPFCGHATIAAGVAIAERAGAGSLVMHTRNGPVGVLTDVDPLGAATATLTSVPPAVLPVEPDALADAVGILGYSEADLDPALPPRVAFAGAHHLVLAARTRARLAQLDYDFDALADLMRAEDWTTVQIVWRESENVFHARDPFPVGGVVEDPATGAAAAAFGAYLRDLALVDLPAKVVIHQGEDLGRPGVLTVGIPADRPEIDVTGHAVVIEHLE
jgi:PhzF family phenazine biosynthesis protein